MGPWKETVSDMRQIFLTRFRKEAVAGAALSFLATDSIAWLRLSSDLTRWLRFFVSEKVIGVQSACS